MVNHSQEPRPKIRIQNLSYAYGGVPALKNVNLDVPANEITIFFGPAGGGKTTLLRLINRLNDLLEGFEMSGQITLDGVDIYAPGTNVSDLRRQVGMVFALPLPLPGTVRENVEYGPRLAGIRQREILDELVLNSLTQAALWDEVKDRLDAPANSLSGGQQQRLCIARSLALKPQVLLLDEPTSGLDPISTGKVEESLISLKEKYTIILVPHSIQQAARMADSAAFFLMGELVEYRSGKEIFTTAHDKRTEEYITGRFG
ncbi:MAG TPA: phosphate ABC transporter ATP-binding protein [Anaerolineales bacterium]|nr:phosphate ABC transporter ATP-binding protein [Anaerolineales bacterium]